MKEELVEIGGIVIDKQRDASFKVQVHDTEHIVMAQISGRMRRNRIRVLIGDRVTLKCRLTIYQRAESHFATNKNNFNKQKTE